MRTTTTLIAIYRSVDTASDVVINLVDGGFPHEDISLIVTDESGEHTVSLNTEQIVEDAEGFETGDGAGFGALVGTLAGLGISLGALVIPGIGPVIAAGPILAALTGGAVGAATGEIGTALINMGVADEDAKQLDENLLDGAAMLGVQTDGENARNASGILYKRKPAGRIIMTSA